jgi:hypothetical protein
VIRVKTAEFKNHLSKYLGIPRTTGDTSLEFRDKFDQVAPQP